MSLPAPETPTGPVLVVHADVHFAARVVEALSRQGLRAETVASGERAIDRFVQSPACALVVDSDLPGRDGAATIESIRWAPGGGQIPVLLTARHSSATKLSETGKRLGAATLEGAAARDADAVAQLVRRALGQLVVAQPPRDALTASAILATHTSPTLSALPVGGPVALDDDDSLPPVRSTGAARVSRERETVAARVRPPMLAEPSPSRRRAGTSEPRPRIADGSTPFMRGDDPGAEQEGNDVERRAADLTPGAVTHAGRLAALAFPRLLAQLAAQRATGALVVVAQDDDRLRTTTGESPKKVVYFRNGVPVYVKSNLVRECLGQILVQNDAITPEVRNESVQRMRAGEGRQGAILLAMGALAPHELREALEEQLRVKLYDLFAWEDADFRFSSRVLPPPEVVTLELGLAEIVFEGVVRRIPPARLLELLEPRRRSYVVPSTDRLTRFVRLDLVVEARLVLRMIDGTQRVEDLLTMAGQRPAAAAQLLYAMECLGALRLSDVPVPSRDLGQSRAEPEGDDAAPPEPLPAFAVPLGPRDASAADLPRPPGDGVRAASPAASAPEADPAAWDDETHDESGVERARDWADDARPPIAVASAEPVDGAALDVRVARIAEAERHFRRGERALTRSKHADAALAFARAVELVPDEGEFIARLAHTRLLAAPDDDAVQTAALTELVRATQLAPKHYLTHLLLAGARRATGDFGGARDAYEDAIAANPDCLEALEGLRSL